MRVVFKIDVIGWGFGRETLIARSHAARGTLSQAELRAKQRPEHACQAILLTEPFYQAIFFAYDYRRKIAEIREKRA
jgi:hypothetical protein